MITASTEEPTSKHQVATGQTMREIAAHTRDVVTQLEQIERSGGTGSLRGASGKALAISSLGKVLFPEQGYTKGDVMRYYARVASVILPVMAGRPLVLKRSPAGLSGTTFFQQNAPRDVPAAVRTAAIERKAGDVRTRIVGGTLATLLYTVQIGCISVDPWHSRVRSLDTADYAVLDLDPGPNTPFSRIVQVAHTIETELDSLGLVAALKTSGSRGLHIVLPLPRGTSYDTAALLAERLANRVVDRRPDVATVERSLEARPPGAVYVDHLQNARGKSLAAAYCLRARSGATVSAPLAWSELTADLDPAAFTIETMPQRIATVGDLWERAMRGRNTKRTIRAVTASGGG
jgi:bifunctional non-homologous end joining protein LigD